MASTISSALLALISGVLGGFSTIDLGAEPSSVSPLASRSALLQQQVSNDVLDTKITLQLHVFRETYVGALVRASFLAPNLRVGLTMTALLPVSLESYTEELLAGRVVSVPFDGPAVVEGMVLPTTASSQDAVVRGTLAAGLEEAEDLLMHIDKLGKVLDCN